MLGVCPTAHLPLCPVGVSLCWECVLQPTYHFVQLECLCWECVLQPTYHFVQLACLCVGSESYSPLTTLSSWNFVQLECLCVGSESYSPLTTLSSWSVSVLGVRPTATYHFVQLERLCVGSASYSPLTTLSSWSVSVLGVRPTAHLPLCPVGASLCWECVLQPAYHFVQLECLCVGSASYSPLTTLSSWSVSVLGVRPTAHLPLCPVGVSLCWECVLQPTYHFVQLECLCVGSASYSHLPLCPVGVSLCWECVLQPTYHFVQLECLCVGSASYSHLPLCPVGVSLCWECVLQPTYHFVQLECLCVGSASYSPLTTLSSWSVSVLGVCPTAHLPLCPVGVSLCWECVLQPTYHFVQLECLCVGSASYSPLTTLSSWSVSVLGVRPTATYHFVQLACLCVGSASYSPLTTLSSWSVSVLGVRPTAHLPLCPVGVSLCWECVLQPLTTLSSWSVSVLGVRPTAHLPLCPVGVSLCWECILQPTYHFVQLECLRVGSASYSLLTTLSSWSVSVLGVRPTAHLPLCPVGVSVCWECVLQPTYHFVQLECLCVGSASYSHLPLCPVGVSLCWECVLQPTYHFDQLKCLSVGSASYSPLTTLSSWSVSVLGVRPTAHLPLCPVGVSVCWECVLQPTYHFVQLECLRVGSASYSPLTTLSSWSVSVLGVRPTACLPLCPVGVSPCWECVLQPAYHFVQLECLCVGSASYSPLTTLSSWSVSVLGVRPTATYHFVQLECLRVGSASYSPLTTLSSWSVCVGSASYSPLTTLPSWSVSVLRVRPTAHLPLCPVGVSLCWQCVLQPTYHFVQLECLCWECVLQPTYHFVQLERLCVGSASYSPLTTLSSWSVSVLGVRPTAHLPLCPVGASLCWECVLQPTYHFVQLECLCVGSASYSPLTTLSSWSVSVLGVRPTAHLPLCPVGVSVLGVRPTAHLPLCPVGVSLCWECVLQPTYHFVQLECLCVGSASYSPQ